MKLAWLSAMARATARRWRMPEAITWIEAGRLAACSYPKTADSLGDLARQGVTRLINLHERAHPPDLLASLGIAELHIPVRDFTPPAPAQLEQGVAAIEEGLADGKVVAVHCGGGLGRTGTLLACYLVRRGYGADEAIARVRDARPGSVETPAQEAAVRDYAQENVIFRTERET